MSQNTFAQTINTWNAIQYYYHNSPNESWVLNTVNSTNMIHNFQRKAFGAIYRINASGSLPNQLKGSSFAGSGIIHIEILHDTGIDGGFQCPNLVELTVFPEQGTVTSSNSQIDYCRMISTDGTTDKYDIKVSSSGNLSATTNVTSFFIRVIGTSQKPIIQFTATPNSYTSIYLKADINFAMTTDANTSVLGDINQNITNINNSINDHYDKEQEAVDNISNQSPSDISNAENQATTNLIGVLSGFINAFSNINATNCSLTLEFPNYAGGTRVVDICQGKDKAPRIVEIGSSLLLIAVFVPLAYILIKMIYNEIRSWTNG